MTDPLLGKFGGGEAFAPSSGQESFTPFPDENEAVRSGRNLEAKLDQFVRTALDPSMVLGMAVGSTVFTAARSMLLPRLLSSSRMAALPFAARTIASSIALLPEVGAFWASSKALREVLESGEPSWDTKSNWQELRGLLLTLGALKASGFVFSKAGAWAAQAQGPGSVLSGAMARLSQPMWQQGGMLAGIMMGHGAEMSLGWRPRQNFSSLLHESLLMLSQFNIGGALSQKTFNSLYDYNARLNVKTTLQEQSRLRELKEGAFLERLRRNFSGQGGLRGNMVWGMPGMLPAGTPLGHELLIKMSSSNGDGEGLPGGGRRLLGEPLESSQAERDNRSATQEPLGDPLTPEEGGERNSEISSADRSESTRPVQQELYPDSNFRFFPERSGGEKDPYETSGDDTPFPRDMLVRIPEAARNAVLENIGFSKAEISEVNRDRLNRISESDFGFGLGSALESGLKEFLRPGLEAYQGTRVEDLEEGRQDQVRMLDELVGVVQYARRAGQKVVLESVEAAIGKEGWEKYEILKRGLVQLLGPHLDQGPLGPHQAVVSVGSGDMMGLLALYRHRIMPGEYSWRTRLFAIARNPEVAREINETGLYQEKLGSDKRINFRDDPPIEAIPPDPSSGETDPYLYRDPYSGREISRKDVLSKVQLQMLNVPSRALHQVLSKEYIENLPGKAHLVEGIKGFVGPDRGEYHPTAAEQKTLLPFELIEKALERYGRTDVEVVTAAGFIPGKHLWWHKPVSMAFAGRESEKRRRFSPGAHFVAEAFAGEVMSTPFLEAGTTHHQRSSEIGGAMKNILSVWAGVKAIRFATEHLGRDMSAEELEVQLEFGIIRPLETILKDMLIREGIRRDRIGFRPEVEQDLKGCLNLNLRAVLELVRDALDSQVPIHNLPKLVEWVQDRVVARRYEFADTRNPPMGLIVGLVELWNSRGANLNMREIIDKITLTKEGVDSLAPAVLRNNYPQHPIEDRLHDAEIYELHDLVNPDAPAERPVKISEQIRAALAGEIPGIVPQDLRKALEGRSQHTVRILEREIERLHSREARLRDQSQEPRLRQALERQRQLFPHLLAAMKEGDIRTVLDFPFYFPPYENVVRIPLSQGGLETNLTYTYIRVDGLGIYDRLSTLGYYLRSFGPNAKLHLHVEATGLEGKENADKVWEIENTAEEILTAFRRANPESDIQLWLNKGELEAEPGSREELKRAKLYPALQPLVERLNASQPELNYSAKDVRRARYGHSEVMGQFMTREEGWPMLLGYEGGPFQRALHAALPRPEKQTLIKIYSGGRLLDVFSVYRGEGNEPMALNHHLMRTFVETYAEDYGRQSAVEYFKGLPLQEFLNNMDRYATDRGMGKLSYQIADLKSLPLEMALTGHVEGVNPAVLRLFLQGESSEREEMIKKINPFYERAFEEIREELRAILLRYLKPFEEKRQVTFLGNPLYEAFKKRGANAFRHLIYRRRDTHSSYPPPKKVSE